LRNLRFEREPDSAIAYKGTNGKTTEGTANTENTEKRGLDDPSANAILEA
jgi:hypothetical protein